jgi:hypothetical protein
MIKIALPGKEIPDYVQASAKIETIDFPRGVTPAWIAGV